MRRTVDPAAAHGDITKQHYVLNTSPLGGRHSRHSTITVLAVLFIGPSDAQATAQKNPDGEKLYGQSCGV